MGWYTGQVTAMRAYCGKQVVVFMVETRNGCGTEEENLHGRLFSM